MKNINNTKVKHQNVNRKVISRINGKTYDLFLHKYLHVQTYKRQACYVYFR